MRTILAATILLAACGDDPAPAATYHVSWTVADTGAPAAPTCASYRIADVVVSATNTATGDTHMISAPCTAGMVDLPSVPLGSHTIKLDAMGELGDVAGTAQTTGSLTKVGMAVTLASVEIQVAAPTTMSHVTWMVRANGAASTCAAITSQNGVRVTNTPMGQAALVDLWDCARPNATVAVPYGKFTVQAEIIDVGNAALGTSPVINVDAARGTVATGVTIDVP
jgi:hypothetical protein